MLNESNNENLVFKQTPVIATVSVILFVCLILLIAGRAKPALYLYSVAIGTAVLLLSTLPRITIKDGKITRRYFFGYSSRPVNLNELSSLSSWFILGRGGRTNYLKFIDKHNNGVSVNFGPELGPPLWGNQKVLRLKLAEYVQESELKITKQATNILRIR